MNGARAIDLDETQFYLNLLRNAGSTAQYDRLFEQLVDIYKFTPASLGGESIAEREEIRFAKMMTRAARSATNTFLAGWTEYHSWAIASPMPSI